jgi:hypothetical protein
VLRVVYVVLPILARVRREYIFLRHGYGFRRPNFVVAVYSFSVGCFPCFRLSGINEGKVELCFVQHSTPVDVYCKV